MFASAQNFTRNLVGAAGTLFFAGLCVVGATATPANAQVAYSVNEAGQRVAYVSYADLNLGSTDGRARLESRLRHAAKRVCQGSGENPLAVAQEYRCYSEALKATRNATMAAIEAEKLAA
ncbi:UrcA family protein [Sandarakinorhabdus sp. AAP62]|uniref:UrcA family protein n=1 Tax=Sandarakinorhabdus sp. AAP62 TaxID=1248916 RepID=UPI000313D2F1|nr:UrcA family protein [Sandarakinorhabdus sp. AAP62]